MDMSTGQKEMLGDLSALGSGVLAWMYTSTKAMDTSATPLKQRFEDALANTLGKGVMVAIDKSYTGAGDLTPKLSGFLNKTTAGGVLLLIGDHLAQGIPEYKHKLDGLHNIIEGVGWGVTIGGIVGGIFDPDVSQVANIATGAYLVPPSTPTYGNVPFGRAAGLQVAVV